jgi:hypothetical protein
MHRKATTAALGRRSDQPFSTVSANVGHADEFGDRLTRSSPVTGAAANARFRPQQPPRFNYSTVILLVNSHSVQSR